MIHVSEPLDGIPDHNSKSTINDQSYYFSYCPLISPEAIVLQANPSHIINLEGRGTKVPNSLKRWDNFCDLQQTFTIRVPRDEGNITPVCWGRGYLIQDYYGHLIVLNCQIYVIHDKIRDMKS